MLWKVCLVKKDTSEGSLAETSVASSSSGGGGGSDDLKSSEKSSSDVTSSAEKSVSNSSSSVAVASSAEEVVESDLVKNSKLNVNAQAFKPSGNYFTPAAQTQVCEDEIKINCFCFAKVPEWILSNG